MDAYLRFLRSTPAFVPEGDVRAGAAPAFLLPLSRAAASPPLPLDVEETVASLLGDDLWRHALVYGAGFAAVFLAAPLLLRATFGPGFARLDAKARELSRSYVFALAHHAATCAVAFPAIWLDFSRGVVVPSRMAGVVPLSAAYLLVDTLLFVLPETLRGGGLGYLPHHLLGLGVTLAAAQAPLRLMRFAAHMSVCEVSNFFLAALYACEKGAVPPGAPHHAALQALFFASFTLTRVVNLPLALAALCFAHARDWDAIGSVGQLSAVAILLLQVFWFGKIVDKIRRNIYTAMGWKREEGRRAGEAGAAAADTGAGAGAGAGAVPAVPAAPAAPPAPAIAAGSGGGGARPEFATLRAQLHEAAQHYAEDLSAAQGAKKKESLRSRA